MVKTGNVASLLSSARRRLLLAELALLDAQIDASRPNAAPRSPNARGRAKAPIGLLPITPPVKRTRKPSQRDVDVQDVLTNLGWRKPRLSRQQKAEYEVVKHNLAPLALKTSQLRSKRHDVPVAQAKRARAPGRPIQPNLTRGRPKAGKNKRTNAVREPWVAQGISRRTWYRHLAKERQGTPAAYRAHRIAAE